MRRVLLPLGAKRNAGKGAIVAVPLASILGVPFRSRASAILHYLLLTISPTSSKLRAILVVPMPSIPGLSRDAMPSQCSLNQASRGLKAYGDLLAANPLSYPLPISVPCFPP